jgi:asparagine synthetase B (glutamine-hydrolysing)
MCGFFVTSKRVDSLGYINEYIQYRGPDAVRCHTQNGITFCHSLLSITGAVREQPFRSDSGDIVCVFNGEIYNYRSFGEYSSDGEILIPLYCEHGAGFTGMLDGEFALVLVDFANDIVLCATDAFATKPLWTSFEGDEFGAASYRSAIDRLGFHAPEKQAANLTRVTDLRDWRTISTTAYFEFDPANQHKKHYDDWVGAFEQAVRKRTAGLRERLFIGLSSGYDSGAIACELTNQSVAYKAFSIEGVENAEIIRKRHKLERHPPEYMVVEEPQYRAAQRHVSECCEEFTYRIEVSDGRVMAERSIRTDSASYALACICARAREEGYKVYLSGQGSDEIISDYGHKGRRIYPQSTFGGQFPDDLENHFPWPSFYDSAQVSYLAKEEYVLGSFGMEARYPFLDPTLVQEFLWLDARLKNAQYKAPLHMYLWLNEYPFEQKKIGFNCGSRWKKTRVYHREMGRIIERGQ